MRDDLYSEIEKVAYELHIDVGQKTHHERAKTVASEEAYKSRHLNILTIRVNHGFTAIYSDYAGRSCEKDHE